MPILSRILKPLETIAIPFGEEAVTVTYRPQYLTPEFEEKLKGLNTEDKATEAFLELFCSLIAKWDLKEDDADAEPIKISPATLKRVPYDILGDILNRVQEAVVPNQPTGQTSDAISQPAVG